VFFVDITKYRSNGTTPIGVMMLVHFFTILAVRLHIFLVTFLVTLVISEHTNLHCGPKKLHHFISAITLPKRFTVKQLLAHIYFYKLGTKRPQNH